ncbi:NAD(P)-binding protein [Sporormia fimetaria CBS 119925]|uniref:NAD(P)-binding protein n=1 Tax=Sporormia fimetaria CBS 119925 TaxID=1340428 RepID=A0A6A6V1W4_9PLEO|nr:NAD(P)-binding protein [Sporormia fimetaria CBS 119925]
MSSFNQKVCFITGCSSGIGLATTQLLLNRTAKVFGVDFSEFKHELTESQSSSFKFHQADLTKENACEDAVAACQSAFGKVDVLINCAGIIDGWGSADTVKDNELERVMAINLTVPIKMMRAVLPGMKERKSGAIVNVGSKAATSGASSGIAYTASKHGLIGATKNVAWRFHNDGIRCNAVLPGGVSTNIHNSVQQDCFDPAGFNTFFPIVQLHVSKDADGNPIPVVGSDHVAKTIAFLASDEANMVSGAMIPVDNAWSVI